MDLQDILQEYIEQIMPQMIRQEFHLALVKGGKEYPHLPEQSHFAHIINGVFGLSRLLIYLEEKKIFSMSAKQYKRVLSLYTAHDLHKTETTMDGSGFAVSLSDIEKAVKALNLDQFAETTLEEHRAANVHFRSSHKADFIAAFADDLRVWTLVRIADAMASMTCAGTSSALGTLKRYLGELSSDLLLHYSLYYHELNDVRGVLTNLLHSLVSKSLYQKLHLFPLLFFPDGVIYLGPKNLSEFDRNRYIHFLSQNLLSAGLSTLEARDQAREGMRTTKYDFQKYVYLFADIETLLQVTGDFALNAKPDVKFAEKEITKLLEKKQMIFSDVWEFTEKMKISLDEPKEFNQLWFTVYRCLLVVDSLVRELIDKNDRLSWFMAHFDIPQEIREPLMTFSPIFLKGGLGKYVLIVGYHFLKGSDFADQTAIQRPPSDVLALLEEKLLTAFKQHDLSQIKHLAAKELGLEEDMENYLQENLMFSWESEMQLTDDAFATYIKPRKKKTSRICSLCSRDTRFFKDDKNREMREGILGDFVQGFSNRNLPVKTQSNNMCWCPTCYLEFMLRSIAQLTPPAGTDKAKSKRFYFYLFPTFSFTPEHALWLDKILKPFKKLTRLQVQDYGKDLPGHPRIWLEKRSFQEDLMEDLIGVFEREAGRMEEWKQKTGKEFSGDRAYTTTLDQSNYYMFIWEKTAYSSTDEAQVPTRSEMWTKALFASVILSSLTSCKVIVTEKPYLPFADSTMIKSTILLDAPHNILRGILPERTGEISLHDFRSMLDLSAAVWQINSDVSRRTKDKHVAACLEKLTTEPLAGAYFYKEFARLHEEKTPHDLYTRACTILLQYMGGEKMELTEQLAEKSLEIFLPFGRFGRGKAHAYELIFREAADGFKKVYKKVMPPHAVQSPESEQLTEVKHLLSGRLLKRLESRQENKRGEGMINPGRKALNVLVQEFVELIVDKLFLERSHGSFTEFNQMINSVADGIYFVTDMRINEKWQVYKQQKAERQAANSANGELNFEGK